VFRQLHAFTCEVMEALPVPPYNDRMTAALPASSSIRTKALVAVAILLVFGAYSTWVVAGHGYTGFLTLAMRETWAMQMLIDLVIACSFGLGWMFADAKKHAITTWPFVVATVLLGSIGLLGYVVWRGFTRA